MGWWLGAWVGGWEAGTWGGLVCCFLLVWKVKKKKEGLDYEACLFQKVTNLIVKKKLSQGIVSVIYISELEDMRLVAEQV